MLHRFGRSFLYYENGEDTYEAVLYVDRVEDVKNLVIRPYTFVAISYNNIALPSNILPIKHYIVESGETKLFWKDYLEMRYKGLFTVNFCVYHISIYDGLLRIIINQESATLHENARCEFLEVLTKDQKNIQGCIEIVYFLERLATLVLRPSQMVDTLRYPMLV